MTRMLVSRERLRVRYTRRGRDAHRGRFGGGWQWCLGFDASAGFRTVIINLLVCYLRINVGRRRA